MKLKRVLISFVVFFFIQGIYSQKKYQKLSEYAASNGITYKEGDRIKMSYGSDYDGRFKSLNIGEGVLSTSEEIGLPAVFSNFIFTISKIVKFNTSRYKTVVFYIKGEPMASFNMDIEVAIENCEIWDCSKTSPKVELDSSFKSKNKYEKINQYKASNGVVYKIGDEIKLNKGFARNGNFVFLKDVENGLMSFYRKEESKAKREGETIVIEKIKKYNLKYLDGVYFSVNVKGRSYNSVLDIENALYRCEVGDCSKKEIKPNNEVKQETEKTDSKPVVKEDKYELLRKVKKLFDEGILTEEEYLAEKKKILTKE